MDIDNLKKAAKAIRSVVSKQDMSDMSWNSVEGWLSAIERELKTSKQETCEGCGKPSEHGLCRACYEQDLYNSYMSMVF